MVEATGHKSRIGDKKMSNMSYCRFENTYRDLLDCESAIEEAIEEGPDHDISKSEKEYRDKLIELCENIVNMADDLREAERREDS